MKVYETIKKADVFSQPFSFRAGHHSKQFQTKVGGVITIIGGTLFAILSVWTLWKLRNSTDPIISEYDFKLQNPPPLNLSALNATTAFWIATDTKIYTNWSDFSRFFTIKRTYVTTRRDPEGRSIEEKSKNIEMRPCRETHQPLIDKVIEYHIKNPHIAQLSLIKIMMDAIFCGVPDDQVDQVEGGQQSPTYTRFETTFYPCSLRDPSKCASFREMAQIKIFSSYLTKVANYSDKAEPLSHVFYDHGTEFYIKPQSKTRMVHFLKKNSIFDNKHDFFGEMFKDSFMDVSAMKATTGTRPSARLYCSESQIDVEGGCDPYFVHIARSADTRTEIYREYPKIFSSISEIGGYTDLIIYVFWSFYFFYNKSQYHLWVKEQLVDHYLYLEQKKGALKRARTQEEVYKLKRYVTSESRQKKEKNKNLTLELLFNSTFNFKNLTELNFKSRILLKILTN